MNEFPAWFENLAPLPGEGIAYTINRSDILTKDFRHFLEFFNIERIVTAGKLGQLWESVLFSIGGFDDDERSLHIIPEVRSYLKELSEQWPYFFYADALENEFLIELVLCRLANIETVSRKAGPNYVATFSPSEANAVCQKLQDGLIELCMRDRTMNDPKFELRKTAIHAHLTKSISDLL
jgi:hypothetical protein